MWLSSSKPSMLMLLTTRQTILPINAYQANHPVHLIDANGTLSPSAFIPFCSWSGDMKALGKMIDNFSLPVCNAFQPR